MENLYLNTPQNFSFKSTVYSHGWSDLKPFQLGQNPVRLSYVYGSSRNQVHFLNIFESGKRRLEIQTEGKLTDPQRKEILNIIERMFRLDEDYAEFYNIAKASDEYSWILKYGAGRLLRGASLWEDMVKMLCTTNCTWRLTQIMTENLVSKMGRGKKNKNSEKTIQTFPAPEEIANKTEKYLRNEIKMGYRAPYLLEFAQSVVSGRLNLQEFESHSISTSDLYKELRGIKGFGDYAVSNLLKLLGRYDFLGADSWSRQKFYDKHFKGKSVDDKKIQSHYKKFGNWSGLFFWMDMTENWYKEDFPW